KLAFREDMQSDPTLTDLQKRMISVIAQHWNNERMHAECSLSFLAVGAGTTERVVKKYKQSIMDSGRVSVKRAATYTTSTLWDVNWWFRGSAYVRHTNGGQPIPDCRMRGVQECAEGGDQVCAGVVTSGAHEGGDQPCQGGD